MLALRPIDAHQPRPLVPQAPTLWVARLTLTAFRNYQTLDIKLPACPLVLTGENGAGKTNLLEAVSLLSPGRGLRRARLTDLAQQRTTTAWAVAGEVITPDGPRYLGTGRDPGQPTNERRVVRIDGTTSKGTAALGAVVDMVWLTPQMDGLLRDGPGERRRFLDRLVFGFDPAHAGRLTAYENALRERLRLLTEGPNDGDWLRALETQLAERAVAIAAARRATVKRLASAMREAQGPFPRAGLAISGEVESWLEGATALEVEDRLRESWARGRLQDAASGTTALGPHRSDLEVQHLGKGQSAGLCSTGEQKALLLAVVMAHARLLKLERGRAPLLLLDEVAAHLDSERRGALFEEILALGLQAWMTGTDLAAFQTLGGAAHYLTVADGHLMSEK